MNESLSGYISCENLEVIVEKTLHKENVTGGAIGYIFGIIAKMIIKQPIPSIKVVLFALQLAIMN